MELEKLQNPDNWDWENAETVSAGAKDRRTVLSVSFPRRDFRKVSEAAKRNRTSVSRFVREAALERACKPPQRHDSFELHPEPPTYASSGVGGPTKILYMQLNGLPLVPNATEARSVRLTLLRWHGRQA